MNFFFYSGFAGGITTTGLDVDFSYCNFMGDYYFLSLGLLVMNYSFVEKGND
jgi:hypothetical protein